MPQTWHVRVGLAVAIALVIGLGLFSTLGTAVAASGDTVTTVLQPGLNLAGWTEAEASVEAIFDAIPELELVYAWDAESQRFGVGSFGTDSGSCSATWTPSRPAWACGSGSVATHPSTGRVPSSPRPASPPLNEGWNLVVWAGDDGIATSDALQEIDDLASEAVDANGEPLATLTRGQPLLVPCVRSEAVVAVGRTTPDRVRQRLLPRRAAGASGASG